MARWPEVALPARQVRVGARTSVWIAPHTGEAEFRAMFDRDLGYEPWVFTALEERLAGYDAVVEIGANVGLYTVFFAVAFRELGREAAIVAFEPSRRAFARLLRNLDLNGAETAQAFNCAVGKTAGPVSFYEPVGALSNGSLQREFAAHFSSRVRESRVLCLDGPAVEALVPGSGRLLLKVDAEGAEPEVLQSLERLIRLRRPDLVLEVLPETADALDRLPFLRSAYRLLALVPGGPSEEPRFRPHAGRDYLLVPR